MTDAESIAVELAKEYGLKAVRFISTPKFQTVTSAALELMTAAEVLDGVFEGGGLNGLFNPYGGIISRIEKLVAESAFSRQLSEDAAERADWAARGRAASRGETLAELVARGEIYPDEAEEAIDGEFAEAEFRAIALDALRGRLR